jgi:trafficking protein particle complex subunit 10
VRLKRAFLELTSKHNCRCVQVTWTSENDSPAIWAELLNKMKDSILGSFSQAVLQREEEIRRSESQRQMPGWNYCTFFILKVSHAPESFDLSLILAQESLANSFEGVHLFEDSYTQYEELEMSFYDVLNERNMSWFGPLIDPSKGDDSAPLLSIVKKPYRQLIIANTISVFDFRIYIHSRQCELLARRGRFSDICRKTEAFLSAFGRRLRDVEVRLTRYIFNSGLHLPGNFAAILYRILDLLFCSQCSRILRSLVCRFRNHWTKTQCF